MAKTSDKPEMVKCPHAVCGHEWEPRVKRPKRCPQCQNPLWRSPNPKKKRVSRDLVITNDPTFTPQSEEAPLTLPIIDTSILESLNDASGADEPESPEPPPVETPIQRARREAEERLRRLADEPIE